MLKEVLERRRGMITEGNMECQEQKRGIERVNIWTWLVGEEDKSPLANAGDLGLIPSQEDSTWRGAIKPMSHSFCGYWAQAP